MSIHSAVEMSSFTLCQSSLIFNMPPPPKVFGGGGILCSGVSVRECVCESVRHEEERERLSLFTEQLSISKQHNRIDNGGFQ